MNAGTPSQTRPASQRREQPQRGLIERKIVGKPVDAVSQPGHPTARSGKEVLRQRQPHRNRDVRVVMDEHLGVWAEAPRLQGNPAGGKRRPQERPLLSRLEPHPATGARRGRRRGFFSGAGRTAISSRRASPRPAR